MNTSAQDRRFNSNTGDIGGIDVTVDGFTVKFDNLPGDSLACQSCGSAVTDWRTARDDNGNHVVAVKVNAERHVAFHARLGF